MQPKYILMRLVHLLFYTGLVINVACGNLDTVDHVHDLRLLAMRAEPPDQIYDLAAPSDAAPPTAVSLTALVADPQGGGRPITYSVATCPALDANSQRCQEQSPGYQMLIQGVSAATPGWVEISFMFTATPALLAAALVEDTYHGLEGLRLPLQLTVTAGDESVVGTKLVVYTQPRGPSPYVPNINPVLTGVSVDGQVWDATTTVPFRLSTAPKAGWDIMPTFDPGLQVPYATNSYTGNSIDLQEAWMFDYFSTWGGFAKPHAGGFGVVASAVAPVDSFWQPPESAPLGAGIFWIVVRDGRGGTNWLVRQAELMP